MRYKNDNKRAAAICDNPFYLLLCTRCATKSRVAHVVPTNYFVQGPKLSPPQHTSKAMMRIKQQGLTLMLKFFILPPQQQRKSIINKIHVQLHPQPPFPPQPPHSPSLNIPLNIVYLHSPIFFGSRIRLVSKSTSQYGKNKILVTTHVNKII